MMGRSPSFLTNKPLGVGVIFFLSFPAPQGYSEQLLLLASKELSRFNQTLAQFSPTLVGGWQRVVSAQRAIVPFQGMKLEEEYHAICRYG